MVIVEIQRLFVFICGNKIITQQKIWGRIEQMDIFNFCELFKHSINKLLPFFVLSKWSPYFQRILMIHQSPCNFIWYPKRLLRDLLHYPYINIKFTKQIYSIGYF